jgi:hypothetical protein
MYSFCFLGIFYYYVCSVVYILFHCVVLCTVCVWMCTVLPPPGVNPIAVKEIYQYIHIEYRFFFSRYTLQRNNWGLNRLFKQQLCRHAWKAGRSRQVQRLDWDLQFIIHKTVLTRFVSCYFCISFFFPFLCFRPKTYIIVTNNKKWLCLSTKSPN